MTEVSRKMQKALGPEVAAFYSDAKGCYVGRIELPMGADGKRRRREITAKDADVFVSKVRAALAKFREAGDLATSSPTVNTWLTYWLDNIAAKRVRPKTLTGYRSVINRQIIPAIGNVRLEKLSGAHVRRVHDHITEHGGSSTYALNAHRVLAKALEDAVREGKMHRNPTGLVDAPRKARTKLEALDMGEGKQIIRKALTAAHVTPYDPEPAKWATYLLTGQRRGEVIGLEWGRVGDVIDMSWQLQRLSESDLANAPADFEWRHIAAGLYWTRPKSEAGFRMIPVAPELAYILDHHRERTDPNQWGLVFTHDGRPIDPDWNTKHWNRSLKAMQITDKRVRLHDIRHTAVDLMLEAGIPEDVVKELVGHSDVAMTRAYKDPTKIKRRREAIDMYSQSFDLGELTVIEAAPPRA